MYALISKTTEAKDESDSEIRRVKSWFTSDAKLTPLEVFWYYPAGALVVPIWEYKMVSSESATEGILL